MKYLLINTSKEIKLEEGTILKFLAQDFNHAAQGYDLAFEIIGNPVKNNHPIKVEFLPKVESK